MTTNRFTPLQLPNKAGRNGLGVGVWAVGPGADVFGGPTRRTIPVFERFALLAEAGMSYYEVHDTEVPPNAVEEALQHARDLGLRCAQYAPSLFTDPDYRDGALTAPRPAIRRKAVQAAKTAVDTAVLLGSELIVFWCARDGIEFPLAKDAREAFRQLVEGFNEIGHYARERHGLAKIRFAIEPKPNEPRGNMFLATVAEALYLIGRLDPAVQPLFGLNPETAHSRLAGLDFVHDVQMCLEADKLFYIHLNAQDGPRYDQDLPFGSTEPVKDLALLVVLQDAAWEGIISFDVRPGRPDDERDVLDALRVSARNLGWLWERAQAVDRDQLRAFREENRLTALGGYLTKCLYGKS